MNALSYFQRKNTGQNNCNFLNHFTLQPHNFNYLCRNYMRQLKITQSITNRESQSLDKYLSEIAKVDLITVQEEVILAQKIREGDQAALERLTKTNLRFVVSVAKQYQNQGLTLGDLINEGNLGLIKAAKRFDETKGFKFISYAVWWIRQSILSAVADQSRIVRLPLNQVGSLSKIRKSSSKLEQQFERVPTPEELAEDLETTVEKISDSLANAGRHLSFDAPFVVGEENTLLDVMQSTDAGTDSMLIIDSLSQEIKRSLGILAERERQVIVLFFGLGSSTAHSLEEIGEKFSLTRERVRQIKDKALMRLRQNSKSRLLQSYL
jgi:RNA polymerase primary sigma factor